MGIEDSTPIQIGTFTCWEEGPPQENPSLSGGTAQRTIYCRWADRWAFWAFMIGGSVTVANNTITYTAQTYPDCNALICTECDLQGVLGDNPVVGPNGMIAYTHAKAYVKYKALDINSQGGPGNDPTLTLDFAEEVITLPGEYLKFTDDDSPLPIGRPYIIPLVNISQTMRRLPSIPLPTILTATRSPLNSDEIFGCDPGTVLFRGSKDTRTQTAFSSNSNLAQYNWDVAYSFTYKEMGWNNFYKPDGTIAPVATQDNQPIYKSSDLNALFQRPL